MLKSFIWVLLGYSSMGDVAAFIKRPEVFGEMFQCGCCRCYIRIFCCNNLCYGNFFVCQLGQLMLKRMKLKQSDPWRPMCSRFHKNKTFKKKRLYTFAKLQDKYVELHVLCT
jgi:hypothetical protein